jgi:exodeoxyribonuclease V gamma subunit
VQANSAGRAKQLVFARNGVAVDVLLMDRAGRTAIVRATHPGFVRHHSATIRRMSLSIRYVRSLAEVVEPAHAFFSRPRELFARPRIVVPTAGAKAWLTAELAKQLGASTGADGTTAGDGIVANVEFSYPGTIVGLLQPERSREPDPWSFDRLTFAVLAVITAPDAGRFGIPFDVESEPLLAARRIAGLFDGYHVRRPAMILEWEREKPNRVLSPTANDEVTDGQPLPDALRDGDRWQVDLWRAVRQRIGQPSPPGRASVDSPLQAGHPPRTDHEKQDHDRQGEHLLVAGLQSLSLHQLECLERLGATADVEALLIHPSPGLHDRWALSLPRPSPGKPPRRRQDPDLPDGVDQMVATWLSGSHDLQELVAAQGIAATPPTVAATAPTNLLERLQRTVTLGCEAEPAAHDLASDRSVVIHRCHSLSRQAEVLHDALLHAFAEIGDLKPHEVVIVSPCLEQAAGHLEAVFARKVPGCDEAGNGTGLRLPLVIADRGLREASEAAELLTRLLTLAGSRCGQEDVLAVAGHPLVRQRFGIDDDTVVSWSELIERAGVRWGLDAAHRRRHGLTLVGGGDVHTWKQGLERMLLGATLADDAQQAAIGGITPLDALDPDDLKSIGPLVEILDVVRDLEAAAVAVKAAAQWCDDIEAVLVALCGAECPELGEPLALLGRLRTAAAGTPAERTPVPFADVRELLLSWLDEKAGRQPLNTGAITATSMVPLRGVPFRVVCVFGYDDGAVSVGEADGDDLVARQSLVGDVDPRTDLRRALLDSVLATRERLLITCNGRSLKNNEPVPLVTPLAELVDFAVRHGVRREKVAAPSGIEVAQPRHHLGRRNFLEGQVQPGIIWSHDRIALDVAPRTWRRAGDEEEGEAEAAGRQTTGSVETSAAGEHPVIEVAQVEQLTIDPLALYVEDTLDIDTYRRDVTATPATFPLALSKSKTARLTRELLDVLLERPADAEAWVTAMRTSGRLPFGLHGDEIQREVTELAAGIGAEATKKKVPLAGLESPEIRLETPAGTVIGHLPGVHEGTGQIVHLLTGKGDRTSYGRPLHVAAVRLLVARAAGLNVEKASIVSRHSKWKPGEDVSPCAIRTVGLAEHLMTKEAARERLAELCELTREAASSPRGLFELAETEPAKRGEAFQEYLVKKNWGTDEPWYPTTLEAVVYGLAPSFTTVFAPGSPEVAFLDRYKSILGLKTVGRTYVLQ